MSLVLKGISPNDLSLYIICRPLCVFIVYVIATSSLSSISTYIPSGCADYALSGELYCMCLRLSFSFLVGPVITLWVFKYSSITWAPVSFVDRLVTLQIGSRINTAVKYFKYLPRGDSTHDCKAESAVDTSTEQTLVPIILNKQLNSFHQKTCHKKTQKNCATVVEIFGAFGGFGFGSGIGSSSSAENQVLAELGQPINCRSRCPTFGWKRCQSFFLQMVFLHLEKTCNTYFWLARRQKVFGTWSGEQCWGALHCTLPLYSTYYCRETYVERNWCLKKSETWIIKLVVAGISYRPISYLFRRANFF